MDDFSLDELDVDKRRKKIIECLDTGGKVKVSDLSRLFGISEVTVRNDLSELESQGLLERVHGGAVRNGKPYFNMSLHDRMKTNEEEKRRIAKTCASMISVGDTVLINSGTTTLYAFQELRNIRNLTIVTNSMAIAREVGFLGNIRLILLGGCYDPDYMFTYGDDTINQLKKYNADKCILSADGVSIEGGITTNHHLEAEVGRQMLARANKSIIIADYTKIGRTGFVFMEPVEDADILVTNLQADQEQIGLFKDKGIDVRLV